MNDTNIQVNENRATRNGKIREAQLQLGLSVAESARIFRLQRRHLRRRQAALWFHRMREVVEAAQEWPSRERRRGGAVLSLPN